MITDYLKTTYKPRARGPEEYDCWGLVRSVRHSVFGKSLLPSFSSIDPHDKRGLTDAYKGVYTEGGFVEVPPRPGAIATAWRASLCVHVGICVEADGRLWVLETNEDTGPQLTRMKMFEARYSRVIYYDD